MPSSKKTCLWISSHLEGWPDIISIFHVILEGRQEGLVVPISSILRLKRAGWRPLRKEANGAVREEGVFKSIYATATCSHRMCYGPFRQRMEWQEKNKK